MFAANPVGVVAVVNIWNPGKAGSESLAHGRLSEVAGPPGLGASWHEEFTVLREEIHDGVEVVRIEGGEERLQDIGRDNHVRSEMKCFAEEGTVHRTDSEKECDRSRGGSIVSPGLFWRPNVRLCCSRSNRCGLAAAADLPLRYAAAANPPP